MTPLAVLLALAAAPARAGGGRAVELVETVAVTVPAGARTLRLWVPKPPSSGPQRSELVSVEAPWPHRLTRERAWGNETVYLEARSPEAGVSTVTLRYRIVRGEQAAAPGEAPRARETRARGRVAVDDEIRAVARRETRGLLDPYEKARALYGYVLRRMSYDKTGTGWGQGDSLFACRVGKGNCTDFHSLFMALGVAARLPTRFRMGYALPADRQGVVSGYHCWAEFYAPGRGWVPVDISEAWRHPERRDYYFGHLDENRVLLSTGREIRLDPPQAGKPLNFLNYPYAETDGEPLPDLAVRRAYRDLASKG